MAKVRFRSLVVAVREVGVAGEAADLHENLNHRLLVLNKTKHLFLHFFCYYIFLFAEIIADDQEEEEEGQDQILWTTPRTHFYSS